MKTILIPAEDHDGMPAVLEAARLVASAFDSYMEGVAVGPALASYVTVEPLDSLAITHAFGPEGAQQALAQFEAFMRAHGVPRADAESTGCSYGWPRAEAVDDAFIGSYGRIFDLIVLGRPGRSVDNARMAPLESALFDSGRPVLVVPPVVSKTIGQNILIAWNGSTEQARANAFALPLLRLAAQVTILTVKGATVPGPTGEEALLHLRRNGIKATASSVEAGSRTAGEIILDYAATHGCDLLIKGAYTQSRLRQIIWGGTTRHILANASLPILMAH